MGSRRTYPVAEELIQVQLAWLVFAFVLLGLAILLVMTIHDPVPIPGVVALDPQVRGHDNQVSLPAESLPAAGGVHRDQWQNCGLYREPIQTVHVVHSLEHGAVWIAYRPDLEAAEIARLEALVRREPFAILSPYPGLRSPIVLTAWSVQLEVTRANDERIKAFVNRYRLGPTVPERGATCAGGVGQPLP